jgi:hypothetical protein
MPDGDAGSALASSDAASASSLREPEPTRASAPATRDVRVAPESEPPPQHALAADAARRDSESQVLGGDGARVVAPKAEARGAVPETGEAASPYEQVATPDERAAPPQPFQAEDATASDDDSASEERRGRVARVREGTRARVENTRARVGRVKGDALVALEDAPDDSGLRFVAVAVVLFVLFLAFLLLSVTILR